MTMFTTMHSFPTPCGSPKLLRESWEAYKRQFIQKDGRVIDHNREGITTSEGQAYALFRAVWMDDQATFNRVLRWSQDNLQVRPDRLLAWKWGKDSSAGVWGILDLESASDADQIFALSLLLAYIQWGETRYRKKALEVLKDIWEREIVIIKGRPFLKPGTWGEIDGGVQINPSYYLPFAYRVFSHFDPGHPWEELLETTYKVLKKARNLVGLPVNWAKVSEEGTLEVEVPDPQALGGDYGYDALRVYLYLALDVVWFGSPESQELLVGVHWPRAFFTIRGHAPAEITYWGFERRPYRALVFDAALLPYLGFVDQEGYGKLCQNILAQYQEGIWGEGDYYTQNIVWFALAITHGVPSIWRAFL